MVQEVSGRASANAAEPALVADATGAASVSALPGDGQAREDAARAIATAVADRCQGKRKPGQSPERYATIWQAARLGALDAFAAAERAA